MKLNHFTTTESLSVEEVYALINRALELKRDPDSVEKHDVQVVNCFFENSTRTQTSFDVAERRCGFTVIPFNPENSSLSKGETLFDTMLTMDALGIGIAVIRSPQNAYYQDLVDNDDLSLSIINAGDGSGQHPSQCLLDLVTIYEEFGKFAGLHIVINGDIKHSRVARSNADLLTRLGASVSFAGPEMWMDPSMDVYGEVMDFDETLPKADVVMLLRVQNERHPELTVADYHQRYGLTLQREQQMKAEAIIMHPAPVNRGVEIDSSLVISAHSRITQQMKNGVYARMAICEAVAKGRKA